MSKPDRKQYTPAFKAKVGLEAQTGPKTAAQIARDYGLRPAQVTQWKTVVRDRLPALFEPPGRGGIGAKVTQARLAQLEEEAARLAVESNWLKQKLNQLGQLKSPEP